MTEIKGGITIPNPLYRPNPRYRPCIIDGEQKALFHMWEQWSDIFPPSPMIGGHNGGAIQHVYGIVEFEDGTVGRASPYSIRFVDNLISEYAFGEGKPND